MVCREKNGSNQENITNGRTRNSAVVVTRHPTVLA
jgi:hypothetical protein